MNAYTQGPVWRNILKDKCPLDGQDLVLNTKGYECALAIAPDPHHCKFFITLAKREELIDKLIKKPRRR